MFRREILVFGRYRVTNAFGNTTFDSNFINIFKGLIILSSICVLTFIN